jgi:saccharopine dehydrogenase (NAD+, L-lysine forming)
MGVGLLAWAFQQTNPGQELGSLNYYSNGDHLAAEIRNVLAEAQKITKREPKVMIIGALGRCGNISFATFFLII